jgi:hypothetical protein
MPTFQRNPSKATMARLPALFQPGKQRQVSSGNSTVWIVAVTVCVTPMSSFHIVFRASRRNRLNCFWLVLLTVRHFSTSKMNTWGFEAFLLTHFEHLFR